MRVVSKSEIVESNLCNSDLSSLRFACDRILVILSLSLRSESISLTRFLGEGSESGMSGMNAREGRV